MYWLRHSGVKWAPRCSVNFISLNLSYLIHGVTYNTWVTPASQTKLIIHKQRWLATFAFPVIADCFPVPCDPIAMRKRTLGNWARISSKSKWRPSARKMRSVIFFFLRLKYVIIEVPFKLSIYCVAIRECTRSFLEAPCQEAGCSFVLR